MSENETQRQQLSLLPKDYVVLNNEQDIRQMRWIKHDNEANIAITESIFPHKNLAFKAETSSPYQQNGTSRLVHSSDELASNKSQKRPFQPAQRQWDPV